METQLETQLDKRTARERMSMRIDLQVLSSFDLIKTTSMMQSVDESVSVCV